MRALWANDEPMSPAEVLDELDAGLAYTSVATVLGRLCDKGLVTRRPSGRKFLYEAAASEADLTGQRIRTLLDAAEDRHAALAGFLNSLETDDADELRRLLEESE
jgi:predicted transcriptional regulator